MLAAASRGAALAVGLAACFGVSGLGRFDRHPIGENGAGRYGFQTTSTALAAGQENAEAAKSSAEFRDCANGCPAMIVIPAGRFSMGSPEDDPDARADERPRHEVTIAGPIAVSKFEATFDQWDACVAAGACSRVPDRWGRGPMPVINVSWNDAKQYVAWLSRVTGKPYRLLTEAEFEYAARAGAAARYSWGDGPAKGEADCDGCGSRWDLRQTAPAGSFKPNAFGLYDTQGDVWEWVEDAWHVAVSQREGAVHAVTSGFASHAARGSVAPPDFDVAASRSSIHHPLWNRIGGSPRRSV